MSNKDSLLALAALLMGATGQMSPSRRYLATHEFQPVPPEGLDAIRDGIAKLNAIPVENFDSLMIVGVVKGSGEPCQDCGEIHENNVAVFNMISGNPTTIKASIIDAMDRARAEGGDF